MIHCRAWRKQRKVITVALRVARETVGVNFVGYNATEADRRVVVLMLGGSIDSGNGRIGLNKYYPDQTTECGTKAVRAEATLRGRHGGELFKSCRAFRVAKFLHEVDRVRRKILLISTDGTGGVLSLVPSQGTDVQG